MPYLVGIYVLILVIVAVDIGVSDGKLVRGVPKIVWLLGSMALPLLGPIAWLALGRPPSDEPPADDRSGSKIATNVHEHGATAGQPGPGEAETAFRRQVRERAEEQRRTAREQRESEA